MLSAQILYLFLTAIVLSIVYPSDPLRLLWVLAQHILRNETPARTCLRYTTTRYSLCHIPRLIVLHARHIYLVVLCLSACTNSTFFLDKTPLRPWFHCLSISHSPFPRKDDRDQHAPAVDKSFFMRSCHRQFTPASYNTMHLARAAAHEAMKVFVSS